MFATVFTWLCVQWFRMSGWKVPKVVPVTLKKYLMVIAPHTSNVDFPVGIAARKIMNLKVRFVAKKELFQFPVRDTLLRLGGFPVDRSKSMSFVDQMAEYYNANEEFSICMTPEGTRSLTQTWKTGFYHIARTSNVPFVLVGFDYAKKWVVCSDPFWPTENLDNDVARMHTFFEKIYPRNPNLSSLHVNK